MSLNLITGYAGKAHITSAGDGAANAAIYGGGRYVLNAGECFDYELLSNNQIRVKSGYAMNQGRKIELAVSDYEDIEIDNGLQGVKRCDLIVISYEKNVASGIETAAMRVIKGTSGDNYADPEYISGDVLSGAVQDDFPLYRVKINGLNVEAVEKLFEIRKGILEDDLKNNVATFDSTDTSDADANTWTSVEKLHSGEMMKSILGKLAAMFKNIRYLYKAHDYDRDTKVTEYYYSDTESEINDTLTGTVIDKIYSKDKGKSPYSTTKEFLSALMGNMAAFYQYFVSYVNPQLLKKQDAKTAITTSNIGNQSVKYAESAGAVSWGNVSGKPSAYTPTSHTHGWDAITGKPSAYTPAAHTHDYIPTSASCNRNWQYSGQGGTPNWVWGSNTADGSTNYVWSPSNFSVNYATYAAHGANNEFSCGYIRMYHSNEGGNLCITSPNGTTYEMDAFNNEFIRIYAGNSDAHLFRVYANGQFDTYYTLSDAGAFRPRGFDNTLKLGTSSNRWKQLYAGTASISTSDRNFKKEIQGLEEKHLNFFLRLIPVSYQFIDGESGRTHIGFIAQDVEDAMEQCGITALDFAGFCKDVKTQSVPIEKKVELLEDEIVTYTDYEERPVLDADGNPEYIYSLRYEEFIALVTYATQKLYGRVDTLESRVEQMEARLAALEK